MKEPKPLLILCGLSGSGKTFSSKLLQEQFPNYKIVGPGYLRQQLHITQYSRKDTPRLLAKVIELIEENHAQGYGSMVDANLKSVDIREFFYDTAKQLGEEVIVLEHHCSDKTAKERMQQREQKHAAENPKNPLVHENQKKIWQDTLLDLSLAEHQHVSLIRFDTEKKQCQIMRKNGTVSEVIAKIITLLAPEGNSLFQKL